MVLIDGYSPDDRRKRMIRLRNTETGLYLHLSAEADIKGTAYAWAGTPAQESALRDRAHAAGRPFPYEAEPVVQQLAGARAFP